MRAQVSGMRFVIFSLGGQGESQAHPPDSRARLYLKRQFVLPHGIGILLELHLQRRQRRMVIGIDTAPIHSALQACNRAFRIPACRLQAGEAECKTRMFRTRCAPDAQDLFGLLVAADIVQQRRQRFARSDMLRRQYKRLFQQRSGPIRLPCPDECQCLAIASAASRSVG